MKELNQNAISLIKYELSNLEKQYEGNVDVYFTISEDTKSTIHILVRSNTMSNTPIAEILIYGGIDYKTGELNYDVFYDDLVDLKDKIDEFFQKTIPVEDFKRIRSVLDQHKSEGHITRYRTTVNDFKNKPSYVTVEIVNHVKSEFFNIVDFSKQSIIQQINSQVEQLNSKD